jgi:iron complex outermembrane receptor protein
MADYRRILLASAAGLIAVSAPGTGAAQAPTTSDGPSAGLTEIIVTSQRREEKLQNVPLSVTALSAAALSARGITDVSKIDTVTPGFTFGRSGNDARPAMRGVRTENVGVNGDTTIGFFVDGIYQSRASQAMLGFVDVARVEVQRGPQGTLFGRNTFGGNIAIVTNAPQPGAFDWAGSASYSSYANSRIEGMINVPLGEKAAFRLVGASAQGDGWVENTTRSDADLFDEDLKYVRGSLRVDLTDKLNVVVRADRAEQGGNGGSAFGYKVVGSYYNFAQGAAIFNSTPLMLNTRPNNRDGIDDNPVLAGVQDLGIPIASRDDPFKIDNDYKTSRDLEKTGVTTEVNFDGGSYALRLISGYVDFSVDRSSDTDFSRNTLGADFQRTSAETTTNEVQFLSKWSGPFQLVAGAYFLKDDLVGLFINQQFPPVLNGVSANGGVPFGGSFYDDQRVETKSNAFYAQGELAVSDKLKLTLGARYTEDEKTFRVFRPLTQSAANPIGVVQPTAALFNFSAVPGQTVTALNRTFEKTTWRAAVDYKLSDANLLYGSVSTGFRSGGFNTSTAEQVQAFQPENVTAYEIGSKNQFFDNRVRLNLAAFFNKYEDLQEQRQIPVGATTLSVVFNAAEAESYGLEVEGEWLATDKLTLAGSLSLMNAEYTTFRDVPLPGGFTSPVVAGAINTALLPPGFKGCRIVPPSATAFGCDLSGNKIPYSPEYSGSISAAYAFDLGALGKLTPMAVLTYSGEFYGTVYNVGLDRTDAFAKGDISVTWDPNQQVSVRAFVDNVTDEEIKNRAVWGGGGTLQASYQPPRIAGVKVSLKR